MRFQSDSEIRSRRRGRRRSLLVLIILVGLALLAAGAFRVGPAPAIRVSPEPRLIGRSTPVEVEVREPTRGLSRVLVELIQNQQSEVLVDQSFDSLPGWKLLGERTPAWTWKIDLGKGAHPGLREGPATVRVTAERAPAWLRHGLPAVHDSKAEVLLTPPQLGVVSNQHYVAQGGSEAVVYRVGESSVRDGVEVGDWFFPGSPLPGGGGADRFALFAVPYDVPDASSVRLVAEDGAGNSRTVEFVDQFFPHPPTSDDIRITDSFLEKVVPAILAASPQLNDRGSLLDNFLQINRDLRTANRKTLRELASKSRPEFLWKANFLALPGGQVMSSFADRRTYYYQGREIDHQVHLGYDLASVAHAPIPAANSGIVVLAHDLGIFGNAVVVDHGYGLMTLYAHLSQIDVHEGDAVKRGQTLGKTGSTGLAGGDHLHFSFLLRGLPVRPVEWWDAHWIEDRIRRKLGAALPFGS